MLRVSAIAILFFVLLPAVSWSTPSEMDLFVSIASGMKQPLRLAPSVTSVITDEDIAASGAQDIDDVLMSIPGLHVSMHPTAYTPIYMMRGIYSKYNQQILMLINGMPITHAYLGSRSIIWGGMPIHKISRIEIIRGPGSALYGADALAGVINIITHTADTLDGNEYGVRIGSFNTKETWWSNTIQNNDLKVSWIFELIKTNGHSEIIDADTQSFFDNEFGSSASLAPGGVNLGKEVFDSSIDINFRDWRFNVFFQRRLNIETGAGNAETLDPIGNMNSSRLMLDLQHSTQFGDNWTLISRLNNYRASEKHYFGVFPPNSMVSSGGAPFLFPEGFIGKPHFREKHLRGNINLSFHGIQNHKPMAHLGFEKTDLYGISERKNFDQNGNPLGSTVDVSNDDTLVFILPKERENYYLALQDEWTLIEDWYLTLGIRYDHYNDLGGTTNPRAALVWDAAYNTTLKLLYGHAFRAPSFAEKYLINNPVSIGNSNVKPETINTYEFVINTNITYRTSLTLNLFRYEISDFLTTETLPNSTIKQSINNGKQTGYGMEVEISHQLSDSLSIDSNYSLQHVESSVTGENPGFAPSSTSYIGINWQISDKWNLNTAANHVEKRERPADGSDTRDSLAPYTLVDLTVQYGKLINNWSASVSIKNIFDEDAREPASIFIPNDLPLAGRSFFGEIEFFF